MTGAVWTARVANPFGEWSFWIRDAGAWRPMAKDETRERNLPRSTAHHARDLDRVYERRKP